MPATRPNWVAPGYEIAWIREQFDLPENQQKMKETPTGHNEVVVAVYQLYVKQFTTPFPGETVGEYEKRMKHYKGKIPKEDMERLRPETQGEFKERVNKTMKSYISRTFSQWKKTQKKMKPVPSMPPMVPLVPPSNVRALSALDVFQGSEDAPAGHMVEGTNRYDVGRQRRDSRAVWQDMDEEQRAPYEAKAREINQSRRGLSEVPVEDEETDSYLAENPIPAVDIAAWVESMLQLLHKRCNWAGTIFVGGPDENGDTRTFIHSVGDNRKGEKFEVALKHATRVSPAALESLLTYWVEQGRREPAPTEETSLQKLVADMVESRPTLSADERNPIARLIAQLQQMLAEASVPASVVGVDASTPAHDRNVVQARSPGPGDVLDIAASEEGGPTRAAQDADRALGLPTDPQFPWSGDSHGSAAGDNPSDLEQRPQGNEGQATVNEEFRNSPPLEFDQHGDFDAACFNSVQLGLTEEHAASGDQGGHSDYERSPAIKRRAPRGGGAKSKRGRGSARDVAGVPMPDEQGGSTYSRPQRDARPTAKKVQLNEEKAAKKGRLSKGS